MSEIPTVSVCMSVYNAAPHLATAIESILSQTFGDFEFLILDDGSTDASPQILRRYAHQDARIRLTCRDNRGIPQTRNELLAQSRGEFIAIMDADDLALPDRLALQVDWLRSHPETVWVGGAFELIDDRGRLLTTVRMAEENARIQRLLLEGHTSYLHPSGTVRKTALEKIGGYNEAWVTASDLDLWLKLTEVGEVVNLPQPVVKYRIHPSAISQRRQMEQGNNAVEVFRQAWARRGLGTPNFAVTGCRFRPQPTRASRQEFMLKYGWWAFNSRQRGTAIDYGLRAIALNPLSSESWKLLVCAALKPLPM